MSLDSLPLFDVFVGLCVTGLLLGLIWMGIEDKRQRNHSIRRNYPIVGRFRDFFEEMGVFVRAYFVESERDELPFNRGERTWVYQASKNVDTTTAFGSTKPHRAGDVIFSNAAFPMQHKEGKEEDLPRIVFGEECCAKPFSTSKLFHISGMSYGALSKQAVMALIKGAERSGSWINTGEGGPSPLHLNSNANVVVQIGTAKFGLRTESGALDKVRLKEVAQFENTKMFEIKLSQGAKPGKGGILPAAKVTPEIAAARLIPVGKDCYSPNRHEDVNSWEELLDVIIEIREIKGKPVGFKMAMGSIAETDVMLSEFSRRYRKDPRACPDFITLDSGLGGTGAAPSSLMCNTGMVLREALPVMVNRLQEYDLKDRIKVVASGKLITPEDVAWALCTGADCVTSARGFMFAMGCIMSLQCSKNTCPTGIATQDKKLAKGLVPEDKGDRVAHYIKNMMKELYIIANTCGVNHPYELSRNHARIVVSQDQSVELSKYYRDF